MSDIYYICNSCGKVFSESEMNYHSDMETSYSHGPKSYDVGYSCCPDCGSDDFEEVSLCQVCGEALIEGKNFNSSFEKYPCDICDDCMEKYASIDAVFKLLDHPDDLTQFKEFILHMFGDERAVLDVIKKELLQAEALDPVETKAKIIDYFDRDRSWTAETIESYEYDQKQNK